MSGVAGLHTFSDEQPDEGALRSMARTLQHRGPDDSAVWAGPGIGLAHTRLAVLDPDEAHQPHHSPDGRWVVALDGEILNLTRLRARLDHPLRTGSDVEVVAAGLAVEGISFVERLDGHFALVAHDRRAGVTHLVRDRLGSLPLYYRHLPGGIAFGSEVKAVLAVGPTPDVDLRSLDCHLASQTVAAPHTLFEGVKKVRPAHRTSLMPHGHLEEIAYWAPPEGDPEGVWTTGDAIEAVGDGVREAVRSALVGDVPVGVHLSGGLAGSIVAAEVQQLRTGPLETFAVGFDVQDPGEVAWPGHVGAVLGAEHHQVQLRAGDFEDLWSHLTWFRDAPVSDPGEVAMFGLSRAAGEHVRVVLSGEGGDDLFGSRPHPYLTRVAERSGVLPARLRERVERRMGAPFGTDERRRLLQAHPPIERRSAPVAGADPSDRWMREDLLRVLPDHVLERDDRLWMAGSVEWRTPLLDHHLVELALRLPTSVRVRGGSARWLLSEVARPLLPDEVIDHRSATTPVPLDAWFRSGLRDTARDWLTGSDSWVARTFDRASVQALLDGHDRGANEGLRLWTLLGLEMWHHCFFGATPIVAAPVVPRPRQAGASVLATHP